MRAWPGACPTSARAGREARDGLHHARQRARHLGGLEWSLDATAHVSPDCLARALEIMERAWPEGEEHMAKLAVNALIGLWARSKDVFYSMCTSNHEVDGRGWTTGASATTTTSTPRSSSPSVPCGPPTISRVPPRYLVAMKTDCLVYQSLPRKFLHTVEALTRRRHRDNPRKYRFEEVKRLEGEYQEPRLETEPPTEQEPWGHVEDPVEHCLNGHSLLLSGMPAASRTSSWGRRRRTTGCAGPSARGAARWTGWWWRRSRSSTSGCGPTSPSSPRTAGCGFCCSGTFDSCRRCRTPSAGPRCCGR